MANDADPRDLDRFLRELRDVYGPDVVRLGMLPQLPFVFWNFRTTDEVVITRNRRQHYLDRHGDMIEYESFLLPALLDPDEVHCNAVDPALAIVYRRLSATHFLRVPVWMSNRRDRQNSVLSLRRARLSEVKEGRKRGRGVWKK